MKRYALVAALLLFVCSKRLYAAPLFPSEESGAAVCSISPFNANAEEDSSTAKAEASGGAGGLPVIRQIRHAESFLESHGITLNGWLQFDSSTVASGGQANPIPYDGQYLLDVSVTVDTKKLFGWTGGTLFVDGQTHSGPNLLMHQMPAFQDADNMDAYSFTKVDQAWYRQDFLRQKLQLQAGLMYVDEQYFTVPYGGNFVSLDFSSDSSISTFVLPTYPKGSPGADVFVYPVKGLYFSFGGFNDHSTELPYDPGGNLYITEEGWQSSWRGLPYKLQIGSWWDSGTFRRFAGGIVYGHAQGTYLVASDKLWEPAHSADRGIGMFFQFGTGPPAVSPVQRHYGGGVVWTGPFAARPQDEIGIAFSDAILTPENPAFVYGFENEFETYYQFAVLHGLTIQPDMEYWQHPHGDGTPNTVLVLARMQYSF
jgi:porin